MARVFRAKKIIPFEMKATHFSQFIPLHEKPAPYKIEKMAVKRKKQQT